MELLHIVAWRPPISLPLMVTLQGTSTHCCALVLLLEQASRQVAFPQFTP
ncbi:hypothetical protein GQ55_6G289800 [Panicum hallii var. hallii]|uniref:Uncharacterized protein n=1 Tax=Panicum hallii var. hallii TaxID=1504633 RepID=A0A2T7DAU4_9POAL|nr:hypothetical protein GQ55_6G289800 [Panicum hallii var. hallii]